MIRNLIFLLILNASIGLSAQNNIIGLNAADYKFSVVLTNAGTTKSDFNYIYRHAREFLLNPILKSEATVFPGAEITLDLFPGKSYNATVTAVKRDINNTLVVRASIQNFPGAFCIITTNNQGTSSLKIEIPQLVEKYNTVSDPRTGVLYLAQLDIERRLQFSCDPIVLGLEETSIVNENIYPNTNSNAVAEIDVLVIYTPAAKTYAEANNGGINNVIANFMAASQIVMDNSLVDINVNMVHSQLINYTESGNSSTDLIRLQDPADGFIDEVHQWRRLYNADLVTFIIVNQDVGGTAFLLNDPVGQPAYGFNLVTLPSIVLDVTIPAHEIGHNMGCHHHKLQNTEPGPGLFEYSAGWRWTGANNNRYCSIMTYEEGIYFPDGLRHNRVPHFSNPNAHFEGIPTGDALDADNARTLRETKHIIAAYSNLLGIPNLEQQSIVIAPNPTSGFIQITTPTPISNVTVFDTQGKLLLKSTSSLINFEALADGIYFVQIETDMGVSVKKVVKH